MSSEQLHVAVLGSSNSLWERSGSVVQCLTRDRGFEPHRRHCVVVLEQDTFILAWYLFNPG